MAGRRSERVDCVCAYLLGSRKRQGRATNDRTGRGSSTSPGSSTASPATKTPATKTQATKTPATKPKAAAKPTSRSTRKLSARVTASRAARAARTARIHQAFVASTELRPMAQQLATLRTPAAYAGVTKLRAYAHRRCGDCGLPGAGARLPAGQALCRSGGKPARGAKAGGELADYADFLGAEANHQGGNDAGRRDFCCVVSPIAIQTAFSMHRRRNLRRTFCWTRERLRRAQRAVAAAPGSASRHRLPAGAGNGCSGAGTERRGRRRTSRGFCWAIL